MPTFEGENNDNSALAAQQKRFDRFLGCLGTLHVVKNNLEGLPWVEVRSSGRSFLCLQHGMRRSKTGKQNL